MLQILDIPTDDVGQVNQVLIASQDQLFALRTDPLGPDFADILDRDLLDRPRKREIETRGQCARIWPAQPGDDALFLGLDLVHAGQQDPDGAQAGQHHRQPALAARSLWQAKVGAAAPAAAPWAFGAALPEDVVYPGGTAGFVATTRQPGIARSIAPAGFVAAGTFSVAGRVIAIAPATATPRALSRHGEPDRLSETVQHVHIHPYRERCAEKQGWRERN